MANPAGVRFPWTRNQSGVWWLSITYGGWERIIRFSYSKATSRDRQCISKTILLIKSTSERKTYNHERAPAEKAARIFWCIRLFVHDSSLHQPEPFTIIRCFNWRQILLWIYQKPNKILAVLYWLTQASRKPTILYMQSAKSYAIHQYTKSYTNFAKDMVIYGDLCPLPLWKNTCNYE